MSDMSEETISAFIIAPCGGGRYAAVLNFDRAGISLPGGEVSEGETPHDSAVRLAEAQGWRMKYTTRQPVSVQRVHGERVEFFAACKATNLIPHEGEDDVAQIEASREEIIASGNGAQFLFELSEEERKGEAIRFAEIQEENKLLAIRAESLHRMITKFETYGLSKDKLQEMEREVAKINRRIKARHPFVIINDNE